MKRNKRKKILAAILTAGILASSLSFSQLTAEVVNATETTGVEDELTPEEKQQKEYEEKLNKAYALPIQTNELAGWPQAVGTYGDAAIVMDAESGAILYAKNIDKQEYPASITKILTALMVYEYDAMDLTVEITAECQECLGAGYAHIGSDVGDTLTMEQAMHAMLLASSNDIAYAIGDAVAKAHGEEYPWFIEQMNVKCKELGGVNSNFLNTNGVFDENHYSCALDMALIGRALFEYPEFFELCQTLQYTIPASENSEEHVFQQKHEMMLPGYNAYFENVIGGKTGYTTEAQNTLVTMADNGELQLVCVVLYEYPGHVYTDTRALLDYGFANFSRVSLNDKEELDSLEGLPDNVYATLPEGISISDLEQVITTDENLAVVEYMYGGMKVASYSIDYQELADQEAAAKAAEEAAKAAAEKKEKEEREAEKQKKLEKILKIAKIGAIVLVVFFVAMLFYLRAEKERRRKERLRRKREARRRAEMERQTQMAVRKPRQKDLESPILYDVQRTRADRHPKRRTNQSQYRNVPRNQNMPRDRRPKNRRFD